ncbi:MAG: diguanylate cyclase [Caldimonas sp.]
MNSDLSLSGPNTVDDVGSAAPERRPALPRLVIWLLIPLCYYAGAKLGVSVAVMPEGVAVLWPPNSVLLTAMLLGRARDIPLIAVLGMTAEVAADVPTFSVPEALVFGVTNAAESALACLLLKAWRFDPRLDTLADLRKFLLAGPLIAAPLAAAVGALVYSHYRGGSTSYLEFLWVWLMGDAMGLLIFTPLLLSFVVGRAAPKERLPVRGFRAVDAAVVLAGAAFTLILASSSGGVVFGMQVAPVLVIPCVVYLATRFDLRVVSASVAVVAVGIAFATANGRSPFGVLTPHQATLRAQEFILAMSLLALGLAALLGQLRAKQTELRESNARLDQLNRSLESRVAERTAQLDDSNRQLQRLALTDSLTGLHNRRAFFAAAQGAVENALRHRRPLAAVMIDVDHFKSINDIHGHTVGDSVLSHVATTLNGMVRGADMLARYGGEEFILLAPETELDSALALACRMGEALRDRPVPVDGGNITLTASFGVTALGGPGDDLDLLIRRADAALYACKRAGRNRAIAVPPPTRAQR